MAYSHESWKNRKKSSHHLRSFNAGLIVFSLHPVYNIGIAYQLFENADRARRARNAHQRLDAISKTTGMISEVPRRVINILTPVCGTWCFTKFRDGLCSEKLTSKNRYPHVRRKKTEHSGDVLPLTPLSHFCPSSG